MPNETEPKPEMRHAGRTWKYYTETARHWIYTTWKEYTGWDYLVVNKK